MLLLIIHTIISTTDYIHNETTDYIHIDYCYTTDYIHNGTTDCIHIDYCYTTDYIHNDYCYGICVHDNMPQVELRLGAVSQVMGVITIL